jgi:hypothetical protein
LCAASWRQRFAIHNSSTTWSRKLSCGSWPPERGVEADTLAPYATVTARNLIASLARNDDRVRRLAHLLADDDPAESSLGGFDAIEISGIASSNGLLLTHSRRSIASR